MEDSEGNVAVIRGGSTGIARATPALLCERAPKSCRSRVATRRRSIRRFTRPAAA